VALFKQEIMTAQSALNTLSTEIGPAEMQNINELTYYIIGSAGVASGAVQAETAHTTGYTGTWAVEGAAVTVAANTVKTVKITGVALFGRVRISTVLAGGTVTVIAVGR
jgi:hypothetical protein